MQNKLIRYSVGRIIGDASTTFIWQVMPQEGAIFEYKPGQFSMIQLFEDDGALTWQKKAYSMSSSPLNRAYLEFGIKIHGDFTQRMAVIKEGETIGVEGPYGIFTFDPQIHTDVVLFAGGIGITPFVSMIRFATEQRLENKILLYYFNQTEEDISYKGALDDLVSKNPYLKVVYSVDNPITDAWRGETGLVNEEKVVNRVKDFSDKYFFMCGPMPFMKAIESILYRRDVSRDCIKREVFG